jgi:multiple sugar transport system substrate-binding protein
MQRLVPVLLAVTLVMGPLGAKAADLVVWWEKGFYPQEDEAVAEIIAAFEQETGKQVDLVLSYSLDELPGKLEAALEAGRPPDFAFGILVDNNMSKWAFENRLVDLTDAVGHFADLFDPDALTQWMLLNAKTGQKALYGLPMGQNTNHIHIWKSLLEQAGLTVEDIPKGWEAFWAFWCDQVQPAVRRVTARDDIWGVGLNMSGESLDTQDQFFQFLAAYNADYVTREGKLVIDDPEVRRRLIVAIEAYTAVYRKGCTPPDATNWPTGDSNNKAFLAQTVVMTPNFTLSIPNALKAERSDDYYENSATIEWPLGPDGEAFPIRSVFEAAAVFTDGGHVATAKEFVHFLVAEGWLAHWLDFAGERILPPMPKLLEAPFWLDPSDRHKMASVMQISSRPRHYYYPTASGDWRHQIVTTERVWPKAVHRVVADGVSPEQAVDEAIARIKQILSE